MMISELKGTINYIALCAIMVIISQCEIVDKLLNYPLMLKIDEKLLISWRGWIYRHVLCFFLSFNDEKRDLIEA